MVRRIGLFSMRWGWLFAVLGGVAYFLLTMIIEVRFPDHWAGSPDRFIGFSYVGFSRLLWIPPFCFLIGLTAIYSYHLNEIGQFAKIGFLISATGFLLEILGIIIEFWVYGLLLIPFIGEFNTGSAGSDLGYNIGSFGAFTLVIGLLVFGIACLRSIEQIRWRFFPIGIWLLFTIIYPLFFLERLVFHGVIYGLFWVGVGYFLKQDFSGERVKVRAVL